jgi:protein arginine kinase activator
MDTAPNAQCPTPNAQSCERCAVKPASVRLRENEDSPQALCDSCFQDWVQTGQDRETADLARFFVLLTRPRPRLPVLELPAMPPGISCPVCGLSYSEFVSHGLAGCAGCYSVFAPAILPALEMLRER